MTWPQKGRWGRGAQTDHRNDHGAESFRICCLGTDAGSRKFRSGVAISSSQPRRNHFRTQLHFLYHQPAFLSSVFKTVDGIEELREAARFTNLRASLSSSLPYRPPVNGAPNTSWTIPYLSRPRSIKRRPKSRLSQSMCQKSSQKSNRSLQRVSHLKVS